MLLPVMAMATGGPMGMALAAGADDGTPWPRRVADLARVTLLGTGLALSNTLAVLRGLTDDRDAVFERTAKGGARSSYRTAADPLGAGELVCAAASAGCALWLLARGVYVVVPFLSLYAAGFGAVGYATIRDTFTAQARAREDVISSQA